MPELFFVIMRQLFLAPIFVVLTSGMYAATPDEAEFFEKRVRPVLAEHCIKCHGPEKQKADLRLDSKTALLKGSDIGPVVVSGKPEESSFIKSIRHEGDSKMPEREDKLPDEQIAALTEWVRMGMPWPESEASTPTHQEAAMRSHWSFQPVRKAEPPAVIDQAWAQSPIDRFVRARMEAANVTPSPQSDRRTLIRRASFDLTGLPPTNEEVEAFEQDQSPDAFARVVDRLLASPRYGERWARHWLDVARYADTKGYVFQEERRYPYSYTYRDWVIRSLNEDLPYDKFLMYQLAADQIAPESDPRPLAAMGFLTLGRRFLNNPHDIIDDRLDLIGRGLMGLTVACARCHDHKFDPIPQKDYYALYGVFASSQEPKDLPLLPDSRDPHTKAEYDKELSKLQGTIDDYLSRKQAERAFWFTLTAHVPVVLPPDQVERSLNRAERDRLREHRNKIDALNAGPLAPPRAMVMRDTENPTQPRVFIRGNPGRPGDAVPRRFLTVLSQGEPTPFKNGSGRLELAQAIASKDNPLTARVIVNRVWLHLFGKGLVRTPGDFGVKGESPTHPELLDWLAGSFVEDGWSLKKLHRRIMLSSTYQQSSNVSAELLEADPENRLLTRMNRRRLDFEAMRDSLLYVTGQLDQQVGGRAVELTQPPFAKRRAVYGFIDRQNLPGTFRTFDFASPDTTNPQRHLTTVPQQALFMMNSPFVIDQARALVDKPEFKDSTAPSEWQIRALYERVYAREAGQTEVDAALKFVAQQMQPQGESDAEKPLWEYGWGGYDGTAKSVTFNRLPHFKDRTWRAAAKLPDDKLGFALLRADGGHVGRNAGQAVIRRWTAPLSAVISIAGVLAKPSENGDAVIGRIILSGKDELARYTVEPKAHSETRIDQLEVKQGDTIDFIVEPGATDNSDDFTWAPLIQSEHGEWDAKLAFSGPPPARGAPLKAWEKYAQVLLATNEFVFVD
jgi:mono/diheme cytochrome c family protein